MEEIKICPIGIESREMWLSRVSHIRIHQILEVMVRYSEANEPLLMDWLIELESFKLHDSELIKEKEVLQVIKNWTLKNKPTPPELVYMLNIDITKNIRPQ